jgi:hypothetical protein
MEERKNNFWMKNQGNINFWGTKVMLKTCYEYFNGVAVNEDVVTQHTTACVVCKSLT